MRGYRRAGDPDPNPPMTAAEFNKHCFYVGLTTQDDIATALQVSGRTVRRWCSGSHEIPGPVRSCLRAWREMFNHGMTLPFGVVPLHGGMHGDKLKAMGMLA